MYLWLYQPEMQFLIIHRPTFNPAPDLSPTPSCTYTCPALPPVPPRYEAGRVYLDRNPDVSFGALLFTTIVLSGWVEFKRLGDIRSPGSQGDGSFLGITDGFKVRLEEFSIWRGSGCVGRGGGSCTR